MMRFRHQNYNNLKFDFLHISRKCASFQPFYSLKSLTCHFQCGQNTEYNGYYKWWLNSSVFKPFCNFFDEVWQSGIQLDA